MPLRLYICILVFPFLSYTDLIYFVIFHLFVPETALFAEDSVWQTGLFAVRIGKLDKVNLIDTHNL